MANAGRPDIREFKIYLSKTPQPNEKIKEDKLVVYYKLADGDPAGSDSVGNSLAAAIEASVGKDAVVDGFAPFYSRVGHGMAWAEEPKYYIQGMDKGSFTESRALAIESVIRGNTTVTRKEDFFDKVNQAFRARGMDPDGPQRHL